MLSIILMSATLASEAIETIVIKGQTPLANHDGEYLLGSVTRLDQEALLSSNAATLTDLLKTRLSSVNINDVQNNPFQPDLQYRGFSASPLLGLPQGISVYVDGFRFNEPFGDTVNWDNIAFSAIDNVALFSGSNPMFGQNTLGGALALALKNGFSYEKTQLTITRANFGGAHYNMQSGGNEGQWGYYVNVNRYDEEGWRDASPSHIKQYLANVTYATSDLRANLLLINTHNAMIGNGAVPELLLTLESPRAIYTQPDQTKTGLKFIGLSVDSTLNNKLELSFNLFSRRNKDASINGDDSDYQACAFGDHLTLCEGEDEGEDDEEHAFGAALAPVQLVGYDSATALSQLTNIDLDSIDGTYNQGFSDNKSHGLSLQLATNWRQKQHLVIGLNAVKSAIKFTSSTQFALLHNDNASARRDVTPIGFYDLESQVGLAVESEDYSLFFSNHSALSEQLSLELGGRYYRHHMAMDDLLGNGEGSLDGDHRFYRFNPAIGLRYQLDNGAVASLSYSESSRTPSPAELSCADEEDPCKLPNGFVSDPPLAQVVAKTWEFGLAYHDQNVSYQAAVFHSISDNDIIFQQAGTHPSRGYFVNVDQTRRQGLELSSTYSAETWSLQGSYNYLDATFESPFVSFSPVNPRGPNRQVAQGSTIPGQPRHQIKLNAAFQVRHWLALGLESSYVSSSYYRGDEANENKKIGAHQLLNLYATVTLSDQLSIGLRVDNVTNSQYFTFGTYGEADEVLGDSYEEITAPYFVGPAKPRALSVKFHYSF